MSVSGSVCFIVVCQPADGKREQLVMECERLGFSNFCFLDCCDDAGKGRGKKQESEGPTAAISGSSFSGLVIFAENSGKALKVVRDNRKDYDFIAIASEKEEVLTECVVEGAGAIDAIIPSFARTKAGRDLARSCAKTGTALFLDFSQILNAPAYFRHVVVRRMGEAVERLQGKNGAKLVIASVTPDFMLLRSPSELSAFFQHVGMRDAVAGDSIEETPLSILKSNRKRRGLPALGVRILTLKTTEEGV